MSEVRVIEDIPPDGPDEPRRAELVRAFRGLHTGGLDPDLNSLLDSELPLGILTDIMAQAMGLPATVKQGFLSEPRVLSRAVQLLDLLREMRERPRPSAAESTAFPPPFSVN
jgi:hypothetical protein